MKLKIVMPIAQNESLNPDVLMAVRDVQTAYRGSAFELGQGSGKNMFAAIAKNRNDGIRKGGYEQFDYVLCWDSDIIGKPNDVAALVQASKGKRIVSAAYRHRVDRKCICAAAGKKTEWLPTWTAGVHKVVMTGAGFLLIPTKVLTKMSSIGRGKWFETRKLKGVQIGEDTCFCMNAAAAGVEMAVHCGAFVNHLLDMERHYGTEEG